MCNKHVFLLVAGPGWRPSVRSSVLQCSYCPHLDVSAGPAVGGEPGIGGAERVHRSRRREKHSAAQGERRRRRDDLPAKAAGWCCAVAPQFFPREWVIETLTLSNRNKLSRSERTARWRARRHRRQRSQRASAKRWSRRRMLSRCVVCDRVRAGQEARLREARHTRKPSCCGARAHRAAK